MKDFVYSLLATTLFFAVMSDSKINAQVINELYGGGGNASATYNRDYVELYNNTMSDVNLAGYSIQYAAASSSSWIVCSIVAVDTTIEASTHYLIQLGSQNLGIGGPIPTPNAIPACDHNIAQAEGKLALVSSTTPLTGTCPTGPQILDFVGYGGANCFEGLAPAIGGGGITTQSIQRIVNGVDTNQNAADFQRAAPTPQASGATAASGSVSGRVLSAKGQGLRFCTVMLSGGSLPEPLYSTTNMFGQYRFDDIPLGEGYILQVFSRRYSFEEPSRFINLNQSITDADFTGDEQ